MTEPLTHSPAPAASAVSDSVHAALESFGPAEPPVQMIAFGLIILAAHLGGRLCRRLRLSEVTGQLLGGAMVGPYALHIMGILPGVKGGMYDDALHAFHFFVFVFLSVVAFGIGEELHVSRLRKVGRAALIICLVQAFTTWALITIGFHVLGGLGFVEAMLIGSIGIATAPAVTFVLMNQLQIEGRLRHVLGSVVVLDDLIEVIIFSILIQLSLRHGETGLQGVATPVAKEILFAALLGGAIYVVLRLLVHRRAYSLESVHGDHQTPAGSSEPAFLQRLLAEHPSPSAEILLVVMGAVSLGAGIAYYSHWPFLITATLAGFLVANFHSHAIFDSLKIDHITPVLNLGFFALIGANISLGSLEDGILWLVGLYIAARMTGKILGTWIGCKITREERKITAVLPSLMLPQAGVAAVEAVYAGVLLGNQRLPAIILPAIVFFEIVGVFLVDHGLKRWRSWVPDEETEMTRKTGECAVCESAGRLLAYLSSEFVKLDLRGTTKKAVIEELVDHVRTRSEEHIDRDQALQLIGERERLAPTGIGKGIAVPHCRLLGLELPILALGRSTIRIDYGGMDHAHCDLFLLMLTPARKPGEHLRLLSAAAHVFNREHVVQGLRAASTPKEVIEILTHTMMDDGPPADPSSGLE